MFKKILLIVLGIGLSALPAYAAKGDGGEAGAFLKMGAGARALSLGKAFVALADDATASYWNPAGLTQIKGHNLCLMYSKPFDKVDGIDYSLVSYARSIPKGSLGVSLIYLNVDGLIERTGNPTDPPVDEFGNKEMALLLSYATEIKQVISVGATLKGISQEIDSAKANGFGLDVGMLYRPTQLSDLRIGVVLANLIGADIRGDKMPLKLRLGVASHFFSDRLHLSLGTDFTSDREVKGHFGAEYELLKSLLLRAGYSTDNEEITGGLGFKVRQFSIDCAYGSDDDLGGTYRVSLGVNF